VRSWRAPFRARFDNHIGMNGDSPSDTPLQLWHVLQRRKGIVLLTMTAATATAVAVSLAINPVYESRSVFYVTDGGDSGTPVAQMHSQLPDNGDSAMASNVAILQSMAIRRSVVEIVKGRDAHSLENAVDVSVRRKASLQVRVLDRDPEMAAQLANAYPVALERFLFQTNADRRWASRSALKLQLSTARMRVNAARAELAQFLSSRSTPSLQKEQDLLLARREQSQNALAAAELRLATVSQRLITTGQQLRDELLQQMGGLQSVVPALARLAKELADLEVDLAAARAEFDGEQGAQHPKVKQLAARVNAKRSQLEQELRSALPGRPASAVAASPDLLREQLRRELLDLQRQRVSASTEISVRRAEVEQMRVSMEQGQDSRLEEQRLLGDLESAQRLADTFAQRMADLETQMLRRDRTVVVLTEAEKADTAMFPSALWNGLLAAMLGGVIGCYVALYSSLSGRARAASSRAVADGVEDEAP
jgi:uncharacterized protein involved in exopolysaccharide biosynthesis